MDGLLSRYENIRYKHLESKCYNSIDTLPVYNWWQIHKTNNYNLLVIDNGKVSNKYLILLWKKIYDEYFEKYGLGDAFISILEKKKEIALLKCERWINDDKSLETLINVASLELEELEKVSGMDFLETKAYIEKTLNFQIDMKRTSVNEYYSYLKIAIENGRNKNKA